MGVNPLRDDKILDRSNLKQSADDNFKIDKNSRKFSKRVENTVGKVGIVHYEQFLLFPPCFQKACFLGVSKGVIVWEWVNTYPAEYKVQTIAQSYFQLINDIILRFLDRKVCNQSAESAGKDQTARMCRLVLLYTLRKISPSSRRTG